MPEIVQKLRLRRGIDFLKFIPHPAQNDFLAGRHIFTQRACSCGTGSGKTKVGIAEDIYWALHYPGSVGFIFEPNYPMMKRILFPTLESRDFLGCKFPYKQNPWVADFVRDPSGMRLDWINGSQWWFVSLEDAERASEGPNIDYAHIDEARLVRNFETAWLGVLRRLRGSQRVKVPVEPSIWVTTTPDAPGTELYNALENPLTASKEMRVFRWSIFDNPTLPKKYVAEIVRTHHGGLADRFIYGKFAAVASGTLPFDSNKHVREIDPKMIEYMTYGVDIGWSNPSAIMANAFDHDGRGYFVDEFYKTETTDEELLEACVEMKQTWGDGVFYVDGRFPQTISKMRKGFVKPDGTKVPGVKAVAYTTKREDGLLELNSRFKPASDGKPRQYVSKRCVNFISEALEYKEDVKENDHAIDAGRYSLPVVRRSKLSVVRARTT
jgi:hypothetical protein